MVSLVVSSADSWEVVPAVCSVQRPLPGLMTSPAMSSAKAQGEIPAALSEAAPAFLPEQAQAAHLAASP